MLFKLDSKSLIFTSFIFMKYPSHYKFSIMDMIFRVTDKAEVVLLVSQLVLDQLVLNRYLTHRKLSVGYQVTYKQDHIQVTGT